MKAPFNTPRGRMPTIEWMPIGELLIDDSYQRSTDNKGSKALIAQIAADWDWDLFDVLKVSRRPDDRCFVVDGQHRRAAAVLRGDITQLPCVVKRNPDAAGEARLFMAANRGRKTMNILDDFRAALGAGEAESILIDEMVRAAGLKIARQQVLRGQAAGELAIVGPIRAALKKRGEIIVRPVLQLIGEAFPDEALIAPAPLFGALVELLALTDHDYDDLFATLLIGTSADWADWADLTRVRGGRSRTIALRAEIERRYALKAAA